MLTVVYKNGQFWLDFGSPIGQLEVLYPKDAMHIPTPVMMGLNYSAVTMATAIVPLSVGSDGKLNVGGITIEAGNIKIGAVEIQDNDSANRLDVVTLDNVFGAGGDHTEGLIVFGKSSSDNKLKPFATDVNGKLQTTIFDSIGNGLTSTDISGKRSLDVNLAAGWPTPAVTVFNGSITLNGVNVDINVSDNAEVRAIMLAFSGATVKNVSAGYYDTVNAIHYKQINQTSYTGLTIVSTDVIPWKKDNANDRLRISVPTNTGETMYYRILVGPLSS